MCEFFFFLEFFEKEKKIYNLIYFKYQSGD